jgi:hypothetical protein
MPKIHRLKNFLIASLITSSLITPFLFTNHGYAINDQTIVDLTNSERAAAGLRTYVWNAALSNSAMLKAQDMCAKGYWAHTAPDGTTAWTFMQRSGYNFVAAGENLAKGFTADTELRAGWMASPTHRANILSTNFVDIGVASKQCVMQGVETTLVVAHYGATRTVNSKQQTPVITKTRPKSVITKTRPVSAPTIPRVSTPQSTVLGTEKPNEADKLHELIWNFYHKNATPIWQLFGKHKLY